MKEISNNSLIKEIKLEPGDYLFDDEILAAGHIALFHMILTGEERRTLGGNKGIHPPNDGDFIRS